MSHEVNLQKKLSKTDREYLIARGEYIAVERNDAEFAGEGSKATGRAPGGAGSTSPASEAGSTPDAPALPNAPADYKAMKVEELKAELDKRKAAYEAAGDEDGATDVTYSSTDKKDDLVTLLEEDDALSGEDEETS
jgi:hypothetical protein